MIIRFPGGRRKALTLSYDDGVQQDARLMELLNAHGLKCTFNLNSGCFAAEGTVYAPGTIHRRFTQAEALALYGGSGHEVALHGLVHPHWTELREMALLKDIGQDRLQLEALFGGLVRGAAYPYGSYSDEVVAALAACGVAYCRTVESSHDFALPRDWLRLKPTCHHADPLLPQLCQRFLAEDAGVSSRLFYLWGHAYEFEAADNWQVIERFAEQMGGRDDIWYATNIQVYDYVTAGRRLLQSADGSRVYNPTDQTLWVQPLGTKRTVCVQPGETAPLT